MINFSTYEKSLLCYQTAKEQRIPAFRVVRWMEAALQVSRHNALLMLKSGRRDFVRGHRIRRVNINTNGSLRNQDWWRKLALPGVTVGFALDGLEDTHALYRQDTDWHRIMENAGLFIAAGGRAVWRFIPFDHNRHQEAACRQMAADMGFAEFENIYDGRNRGPAFYGDGRFSHHIGDLMPTEAVEPPPWQAWLENHITWYDAQTVTHERDTTKLDMRCVHKMKREIYLAADGTVYPCCFLGFYPATMTHPGNRELRELVRSNNALEVGLERAMAWFDSVEETWDKPSVREGRTYQCVVSCNRA